jgi:acyl-CoA reductase-like NAD-dependent aldehyde dehydrogenase
MVSAALAAGNTVVFKPASPTPVLGYALVRMLHEAGVPNGAINYLPGPGADVGDYLAADPRVDLIVFTGSLEVGQSLLKQAALVAPGQRNIKKVVAELGGKNAIIVDADADLDAAVEGVISSAFHYAGQKCSACSRVIVLREVYDQFVHRLTQAAASLKVGDPSDPGTRVGPVITAEARDRILAAVRRGKHEATLSFPLEGWTLPKPDYAPPVTTYKATAAASAAAEESAGSPDEAVTSHAPEDVSVMPVESVPAGQPVPTAEQGPAAGSGSSIEPVPAGEQVSPVEPALPLEPGYFVPPHLFADVPPEASIAQEEIFGPVLAVMKAQDFGHALELALQVRYGLTGGVYSRNPAHIARAYQEFRVGNLYINRPITGAMVGRQPFGGSRMSGVGSKAGGPDYLLQFLEPRTITENTIRRGFAPPNETP